MPIEISRDLGKDGIDVLRDGRSHQVMSSRHGLQREGPLVFWISSDRYVGPNQKKVTDEPCYRVDFFPDQNGTAMESSFHLRTTGKVILGEREVNASFIVFSDFTSVRLDPRK
jgi:hypothetical protein